MEAMTDRREDKEILWYVGSAYPESFDSYFASAYFKADANVSNLIYERRLFKASLKLDPNAKMFCLPHVGVFPQQSKKAKVRFVSDDHAYISVPFNCFFLWKHRSQKRALEKRLLSHASELPPETRIHIVICEAYLPYLQAVSSLIRRGFRIRVTIIVPDLPEFVGSIGKGLRAWLKKRYIRKSELIMRALPADFVLFTKAMEGLPLFQDRNCIVSNGICAPASKGEKEKGLFVFAGKLTESNGVRLILETMKTIRGPAKCEIYGDGPLKKEVEGASKENPSIFYGGHKEPDYIAKRMEVAAGILATRLSSEASPYQFPSKILNSISFMSPVICFDLPVIEEPLRSTLCIVDEDVASLQKAMEAIIDGSCSIDEKARLAAIEAYSASSLAEKIQAL